jgi:hypothetical protein
MSILKKITFSTQFLEIIPMKSLVADGRRQKEGRGLHKLCFFYFVKYLYTITLSTSSALICSLQYVKLLTG